MMLQPNIHVFVDNFGSIVCDQDSVTNGFAVPCEVSSSVVFKGNGRFGSPIHKGKLCI